MNEVKTPEQLVADARSLLAAVSVSEQDAALLAAGVPAAQMVSNSVDPAAAVETVNAAVTAALLNPDTVRAIGLRNGASADEIHARARAFLGL